MIGPLIGPTWEEMKEKRKWGQEQTKWAQASHRGCRVRKTGEGTYITLGHVAQGGWREGECFKEGA
jgi:hypothetical protein